MGDWIALRFSLRRLVPIALQLTAATWLTAQSASPPKPNLIVCNSGDETVSLLSVRGRGSQLVKTLKVGNNPRNAAVTPDGARAYILNSGNGRLKEKGQGSVSVVDLRSLEVVATVTHPNLHFPHGIVISRDGKKAYVSTTWQNSIFVISTATNEVLKEIPAGHKVPFMAALSPDGGRLYVAHAEEPGFLTVVDTATDAVVGSVEGLGWESEGVAFSPDGKMVLATNYDDDTLSFVDAKTNRVERTIGVGRGPLRVLVVPDGKFAFTANTNGNTVGVVDLRGETRAMVRQIPVGRHPFALALNDDGFLYVSNQADNTVTIIDTALMDVVRDFSVGQGPVALCYWSVK